MVFLAQFLQAGSVERLSRFSVSVALFRVAAATVVPADRTAIRISLAVFAIFVLAISVEAQPILRLQQGPVNGVLIEDEGQSVSVYGWQGQDAGIVDRVLLAHGRRDVVWKAIPLIQSGAKATAPNRERFALENPAEFWRNFRKGRFHDYGQQTTKIGAEAVAVDQWVNEGDRISWRDLEFAVLETPGFTRGSVTYVTDLEGKKTAFTGDLIYGDGQILDLYSFQDAIPEAGVRGYHGYGARLADLVHSLRKLDAQQTDLVVPARGPVIRNPSLAINRLIGRVQALYKNYLSTNALHWYFKEDRMRQCGERVLGAGADIELMPYSHHEETPAWVFESSTSRLLISDSGRGFLLDCGYQRVIDAVNDLIGQGVITGVDGIFVTHYHDDHTDMVQAAAETFHCPVYATAEYADLLENPAAYHLPAMTSNSIHKVKVLPDGHNMKWHEFDLTFHFFPGQTWYHGALFARKGEDRPIFFVGDAFAPSGMDDYCVLNRNLLHSDSGYLLCLQKLREIREPYWLVNEHIPFVFSFTRDELNYLQTRYQQRVTIMRKLFPWDDPNYGVDEQWATMYPHSSLVGPGASLNVQLRLINHSATERVFVARFNSPAGMSVSHSTREVTIAGRQAGLIELAATAPDIPGDFLITADISSEGIEFREWCEAVVTVE
ncbi:MAG: MBL fold metallo-hydrolase [Fuerstiella sp.]|nr:MBL fold metallo-hydrolase [Fuerstiella sp.]